ncbi:MAG: hypothetical protein KDC39_11015 [Actinobacteria bacterium]|nr:hypothetical protein [Actinomycetota bacterium]
MGEDSVHVPGAMWHVTLTLTGPPVSSARLADSLSQLAEFHPFGLSARYAIDVIELRYWDEGHDCRTVTDNAIEMWNKNRDEVRLPDWPIVGVEVLDRATFRRRWPNGSDRLDLLKPGVRPFLQPGHD